MIDYIEAIIIDYKGTFFSGYLQKEMEFSRSGDVKYSLNGCKKLHIYHNPNNNVVRICGSIMYFFQGHNFTYNKSNFVDAINYISKIIGLSLWDAKILIFEYGVIMEMEYKPKEYISHHREGTGQTLYSTHTNLFRSFTDPICRRKMYDAGRNIMHKQGMTMKEIIEKEGWNPKGNYLKWEVHYLKPAYHLNRGSAIQLKDLVNPEWEEVFKKDLYYQYKTIQPLKTADMINEGKKLHTNDIILLELVEAKINEGAKLEEIRKMLYSRIDAIESLSNADRDARKRQIKSLFDRIKNSEKSNWDISEIIAKAVNFSNSEE